MTTTPVPASMTNMHPHDGCADRCYCFDCESKPRKLDPMFTVQAAALRRIACNKAASK